MKTNAQKNRIETELRCTPSDSGKKIIWGTIWLAVCIVGAVAGFCAWGAEFIWVVLGVVFCWRILRAVASCLVTFVCLIGFFWFLITHIF